MHTEVVADDVRIRLVVGVDACNGSGQLLVIAGIVVAVMFATRGSGRRSAAGGDPAAPQSHAQGILEERFARGEIDEDEFRRRLETLRR